MSNNSIEEEQPTLSTVRRRLIRQSLGKDLGHNKSGVSSLSDNIDDPFQPLSEKEQKEEFYRHKILADCEKARRPTNPNIPEDVEVLDIEPVSIRYHLQSFADKPDFDQYGTNVGNIHIKTSNIPRSKSTGYPSQVADDAAGPSVEAGPSSRPEPSKRPGEAQVISSSSSKSEKGSKSPVHDFAIKSVLNDDDDSDEEVSQGDNVESPERSEIIDLMDQVTHEESLDEEYNSETDEVDYRQPLILPSNSKVVEASVSKVWLKLAEEKEYCRKAKRFYCLPEGYELTLPPPSATVLDCPDGHIAIYAKHFEFGLRFPLHPFVAKIFKAWNVCLVQVTPPTIRVVIALVWVLLFKNISLTLNLFKRLITLKRDGQSEGKFFFMSVPEDFPIQRTSLRPHPRFGHISERDLGPQEQKACDYFDAVRINVGGKTRVVPKVWLPNVKYILNNAPLSYIGLCWTDAYGPQNLDKTALGLSPDSKRVISRCPPSSRPALETFNSFCSRAPTRNPKRRAKEMADENVRRNRRLTSLANRRGGSVAAISTRKEDEPASKRSKTDTQQPKAPSPPKASEQVVSAMATTNINAEKWIEHVEGKIPDEVLDRVKAPKGRSRDQWRPEMDVFRNRSIFTDDPLWGGNLGYRLLRNVSTPVDRPSGFIGPIAAQHIHDLMRDRYHQNISNQQSTETTLKNAEKALDGIKLIKAKNDAELTSLHEKVDKMKNLEEEIKDLKSQLENKNAVINQLSTVQNDLSNAKATINNLEGKLQKMEADKPRVRQRAVNRYITSVEFCSKLQDRFDGGWTAAHRCAAHAIGLKQEDWEKIEAAFNNDAHKTPYGFEQQKFSDEDIFNLAPSVDIGISDPKILDSPEPENKLA
uniref:Uncharacterized protein n=1 Tax=Chenopodium quinoa TaxID=63459 RepID=A0A803LHK5_CHEQI